MTEKSKIKLNDTTHAIAKRVASELGVSMSEAIGAALEAFDRRSEEDKLKSLAVWMALHAFLETMGGKK